MEELKKKKQPQSLNERHNRILLDLSASQPHHRSNRPHPPEVVGQSKKNSSHGDDDVPGFNGFSDFDSPSPVQSKSPEFEGHGEVSSMVDDKSDVGASLKLKLQTGCRTSSRDNYHNDDVPRFSGIADFDDAPSPAEIKSSKSDHERRIEVSVRAENNEFEDRPGLHEHHIPVEIKPSKSEIERRTQMSMKAENSGFEDKPALHEPHFPENKKTVKVKLGGRRRLCKLSSKDDIDCEDGSMRTKDNEPEFSGLDDFHSPPSSRDAVAKDPSGGNEIRDILNDLTSKLDFLSIEKKRPPKTTEPRLNSLTERKEEQDYASAASSFTLSSDRSDSSAGSTSEGISKTALHKEETDVRSDLKVDDNARRFAGLQNPANRPKENQTKRIGGKSGHVSKATAHNYIRLDEDDDDCVVVSGKNAHKGERKYDQLQGINNNDDDKVDVTEHQNDDFVLEYEKPIISKGSKLTFVLPPKIANMLYAHQREGMKWLWSLHCQGKGGILGDDMGLGKTMQICGFLAGLFNSRLIKRAMVVAPKTLLPHWIKELSVVGLSGKTREYFGTCAKARQYELQYIFQDKGVLLTTYDIVRNNTKALRGDDYFYGESSEDEVTWDYMILDEGHLIKNPSTQRAKSLLEIPSAHRIIISGTPIQNNLKELWALFNFCCPELLGDKTWFKERYESSILRGSDKNASDREKRIGSAAAKELRERIQPHFLRRLKSEVFCDDNATNTASLSKKNELIVWLRLTSCQRQLYEAFLNSEIVLSAFDGSPLAAITILKKICDHPLLLTKRAAEDLLEGMDSMLNQEDSVVAEKLAMHIADVSERSDFGEKHANISCKISFILTLLDNLVSNGHRILIFSQTRKMLNLIQESLITEGYTFLRIDGTSKASDRLKIVNDFQEGGAPIFLLTSQVGGLGLTLTKADRVIVVDPAWNPSTDNQSVDRAYRIGQKKDVIVYRLMTCGTIEEKIYKKQIFKGGLFKTATEHKEQTRYFSQRDLQDMFSLPKHGFDVSITQQQLHQEHDHQHNMDESLKSHIKFLETKGIAGVSHHSLLFSKTAPPVPEGQDDEAERVKATTYMRNTASSSRIDLDVDGAKYAFNPKDVKLQRDRNSPSMNSGGKHSESEIKERINRLSLLLANKSLVSKLPDKGDNIQNQIAQLSLELNMIQTVKRKETEVVDLDDLAGEFRKVLNV